MTRRLLVHGGLLANHVVTAIYLQTIDFSDATHSYVIDVGYFPWRFATVWNFALQMFYFSVCLVEDVMSLNQSKKLDYARGKTRQLISFCFASLIFPAACGVFCNFWVAYSHNRELIYPEAVDAKVPGWINHSLHTTVLLAVLLEAGMTHRPYPKTSSAMLCIHSYVACYTVVSLVTYWLRGTWVYPMLDTMTWYERAVFILVQHVTVVIYYVVGKFINWTLWGRVATPRPLSRRHD